VENAANIDAEEFYRRCAEIGLHSRIVLGEWFIEYDVANLLIDEIKKERTFILELGSGRSTAILAAFAAAFSSNSFVISIEDNKTYLTETAKEIQQLLGGRTKNLFMVLAPPTPIEIKGTSWNWYDPRFCKHLIKPVDFLLVDGPPGDRQHMSRYPALPQLWSYLSDDCVIVLDDGARDDEQQIALRWLKEFPQLTGQYFDTTKGVWLFRKR
jgi:hypothetical protein